MGRRAFLALAGAAAVAGVASCSGSDEEPTPTPSETADPKLTWAPPTLTSPKTVEVTKDKRNLELDPDTDYQVKLPPEPLDLPGGLMISGGRNVVLVGGEVRIPEGLTHDKSKWTTRRGLYLKDQTGVVHVEGVRFSGDLAEGIDLSQSMGATVQLQNIVVEEVKGSYDTNHADLLQIWAGPKVLRIDGFSGVTGYQGFFLLPNQHYDGPKPESFDIRRVRIQGVDGSAYLFWAPTSGVDYLHLTDVQVSVDDTRSRSKFLRPEKTFGAVEQVTRETKLTAVGLPSGTAGATYSTPGYHST